MNADANSDADADAEMLMPSFPNGQQVVDIVTDNWEDGKIPSLIESKIIEAALDVEKHIELREILINSQGLFGSETKDV